jgi:hypothetical protein
LPAIEVAREDEESSAIEDGDRAGDGFIPAALFPRHVRPALDAATRDQVLGVTIPT